MTTHDSRSTDGRGTFTDDELEVAPEEQAYTPPPTSTRSDQPVPIEVLDPPDDDPTPPDVAPQQARADEPVDRRPDVPRTPDGEPTDFEPLRVPVMHEYDAEPESSTTSDVPPAPAPAPAPTAAPPPAAAAEPAGAADDDRWQAIQVRFVDDPSGAVAEAAELVEDAVAALRDDASSSDPTGDSTEQLRRAFRHYRAIHTAVTTPEP